jgi:cation diffusion facilitator CzcD-associated flavoprotein CzcO
MVEKTAQAEHFDVLIVGAGISGIGSAWHLQQKLPGRSFVILDSLDHFGGTWWTHKYPGIRSDSDLFTFGYQFKPWTGAPIATAEAILDYMGEVIEENDLARHIRYGHRITDASWSSETNLWTVTAARVPTGEELIFTTGFLWMCQGYYRHDEGYTPRWAGMDDFKGTVIHPQTWPKDLDYTGKKVAVIGSGATAATVVPNIADAVEHVTMVQRSPTYFVPGRNADDLADTLRDLQVDEAWIHEIVRRSRLKMGRDFTQLTFADPEAARTELLNGVTAFVGEDITAKHFTPSYRPWRQRIAFVPDGDLFEKVKEGKASVATGAIERFTPKGLKLDSGEEIEADIIVTATGFDLSVLGGIAFAVDGKPVDPADTVTYRGMMFTGLPNLVWVFGYFRASWTLRVDILGDFVCRLLAHMDAKGAGKVVVAVPPEDDGMALGPWMDPEDFNPGYLMRSMDRMPKAGTKPEWRHSQDYWIEKDVLPAIDLDAPEFIYEERATKAKAIAAE